jgi:uncharacterized membrane protein
LPLFRGPASIIVNFARTTWFRDVNIATSRPARAAHPLAIGQSTMSLFPPIDLVALGCFVGAWLGYAALVEWTSHGRDGLSAHMDRYREVWIRRMLRRDARMVDMQIMAALQNGTAFFASTSLIAIGGTLSLLRSTEDVLTVMAALPLGVATSRAQWEAKTIGLVIIFAYAFFKFAWSYRLYNYVSILLGAMPFSAECDTPEAEAHIRRTARMFKSAGRHFNRGQRGFFLALGYLGWFAGPYVLIVSTLAVVGVLWRRQFASESRKAVMED